MLSQKMMIIRDLNKGKVIDHLTAFRDYGSWSLRSRIPEVNNFYAQSGKPPVSTEWVERNGKRYKRYFLEK